MRIGIIGAGFTGLSAAHTLLKRGFDVTILEKDEVPGGLAVGYREKEWEWSLEKHYHHWFTNDSDVLSLAQELNHPFVVKNPKTSVYIDSKSYRLDSILSVLLFPLLTIIEKIRMIVVLGFLRYNPFWKLFENSKASSFLPKTMGRKAYSLIWEPQLKNKFGDYSNIISLAWFWARIKKRTSTLAYPVGGFLSFATNLMEHVISRGGKVELKTEVLSIQSIKKEEAYTVDVIKNGKKNSYVFDAIIVTLSGHQFTQLFQNTPTEYRESLLNLKSLGAVNLVLRLKQPFLNDGTYWLSICEKKSPIMAIVEHTNFIDKKYYNNEHLVYLANYIDKNHPYVNMGSDELLALFDPFLRRINPRYKKHIINVHVFKTPFAQPIIPTGYSKIKPFLQTPLKNVFLANMQQVYPWDRGTNYAIKIGKEVANLIIE